MIIDVHVHPVAEDMIEDQRNLRAIQSHSKDRLSNSPVETLLNRMDAGGVDKACLMGPNLCDGIKLTNEIVRNMVACNPNRLFGFAGIGQTNQNESSLKEQLECAVKEWGFKGVGEFGGCNYVAREWDIVYESCMELQVPVLLHVGIPLPSMLLKYGKPELLDELANRYPDLKIIAAHVGMPWIMETIAVAMRHKNVHIDISALPLMRKEIVPFILAVCLDRGLEDQILFGSDFPLVDPGEYAKIVLNCGITAPLRWLLKLPDISLEYKRKVLSGNAVRLLNLENTTETS